MDRKKITAFLIDCSPDDFMAYADLGASTVVVGPDGKKFRFSNEQLEAAEDKIRAKIEAEKPKRKPAARSDAGKSKPKTTTKRQAASKKKPIKINGNGP